MNKRRKRCKRSREVDEKMDWRKTRGRLEKGRRSEGNGMKKGKCKRGREQTVKRKRLDKEDEEGMG